MLLPLVGFYLTSEVAAAAVMKDITSIPGPFKNNSNGPYEYN